MKLPQGRIQKLLILFCALTFSLSAQQKYSTYRPWPSLSKEPKRSAQLFTSIVHADTSTFTLYPSSLPGVFDGDAVFIDYDNDGDLDVLVSGWDGSEPITR